MQAHAPAREYCPVVQMEAVGEEDPRGQKYPAWQLPEQELEVWAEVDPKSPAAQSVQAPAAGPEYLPAGHREAVGLVEPAAHAYPAVHGPEQEAVDWPEVEPYCPEQERGGGRAHGAFNKGLRRHTYRHTQSHTQAHTGTHRHTQAHTQSHTQAHPGTPRHTQAHPGTHRHTQAHTSPHRHTQAHTDTHPGTHTGTHTGTRTGTRTGTHRHTSIHTGTWAHQRGMRCTPPRLQGSTAPQHRSRRFGWWSQTRTRSPPGKDVSHMQTHAEHTWVRIHSMGTHPLGRRCRGGCGGV